MRFERVFNITISAYLILLILLSRYTIDVFEYKRAVYVC